MKIDINGEGFPVVGENPATTTQIAAWAKGIVGATSSGSTQLWHELNGSCHKLPEEIASAVYELNLMASLFPDACLSLCEVPRTSKDYPINAGSDEMRARTVAWYRAEIERLTRYQNQKAFQ
jgi:hypothetical protein